MRMEFAWKKGARFKARPDPQVVGEHLEFLKEQHGGELKAEHVVEDGANPNSPFHSMLDWDDTDAAKQWRVHQARQIIASVQVVYRDEPDSGPKYVKAFVSIKNSEGAPHYASTASVMSDAEKRKQLMRRAWDELQAFKRKYAHLEAFGQLFATIEDLEEGLPPVLAE